MPVQRGKSPLLARYGDKFRKAAEAHKNDEVEFSQFGDLPPGIENGIAQLVDCRFAQYKKGDMQGEWFFYAAGVVVSPEEHNGVPIKGLRTSIMEPICDTPTRSRKSTEEHVAHVQNELKKLGCSPDDLGADALETTAAALKEASPHFRFRTWVGQATEQFPNPRTNHDWNGVVEYSADDAAAGAVTAPPEEGATFDEFAVNEDGAPVDEDAELDALAAQAEEGDEDAMNAIADAARAAGVPEDQLSDETLGWADIVNLIRTSGAEPEAEPESNGMPEKGSVWGYKVIDPKTRKPAVDPRTKRPLKAVQAEVIAVDEKKSTVDLRNTANKRVVYKAVPVDQLIE